MFHLWTQGWHLVENPNTYPEIFDWCNSSDIMGNCYIQYSAFFEIFIDLTKLQLFGYDNMELEFSYFFKNNRCKTSTGSWVFSCGTTLGFSSFFGKLHSWHAFALLQFKRCSCNSLVSCDPRSHMSVIFRMFGAKKENRVHSNFIPSWIPQNTCLPFRAWKMKKTRPKPLIALRICPAPGSKVIHRRLSNAWAGNTSRKKKKEKKKKTEQSWSFRISSSNTSTRKKEWTLDMYFSSMEMHFVQTLITQLKYDVWKLSWRKGCKTSVFFHWMFQINDI